jgi:glycosyltransferase involved in cell wall biosynthesis
MAHALTDLGHDVEVVSLAADTRPNGFMAASTKIGGDSSPRIKVHRAMWQEELDDLRILLVTTPFSHFVIKTSFALWQAFLKAHEEKPFDVAEVPEHLAGGLMPIAAQSVATVVKIHTPHSKFAAEQLHDVVPSFDHQFICMLERFTMLMADELCSPSEDMAKYVANDLGMSVDSIPIVRNPVNTGQFSPDGEMATLPHKGPTVLFVGRLEERKGIRYLIEAVPRVVSEFPSAQFVVVGADTPHAPGGSALAHCKKILQEHGCAESVTFVPQVELSLMPTYYRAADICVVPSLYDNAPYTCIEAMSCGRPVVASTSGGTREYIQPGHTGLLVPPKEPQAIAQAVLRLLRDENERKRMGANARTYVLSSLSNEAIAHQMVRMYESAIQKHNSGAKSRIYHKDQRHLLPDARQLLQAYDQLFYDRFYQHSFRFRLNHWIRIAKKQPELFRTKLTVRLARPLARRFPKSHLAQVVSRLENSIRLRQLESK